LGKFVLCLTTPYWPHQCFILLFGRLKEKKNIFLLFCVAVAKMFFLVFDFFFSKTFWFFSKMSAVACELKMHDLQAEKNTKITNKEFPFFSQFYFWKRKKRLIHFHPSNQQYLLH
jgi:hypothetical protein